MVSLLSLWLPILLGGVAVFFLSFLAWMVLPHHRKDFSKMPDEDAVLDALRDHGVGAGHYSFPHCAGPEDWKDEALQAKYARGPSGFLTVVPEGKQHLGKSMGTSFLYNVVICAITAYVASRTLPMGEEFRKVLQVCSTVAFLGFAGALGWVPIWQGGSWRKTFLECIDALVYGLAVGAIFAFFWPGA